VNYGRDWIIDAVEDAILAVIRPTAGWEVHISEGENVSYGLQWTELALEASDRVLFLHFSFSD
jgi:hypothetical protein